MLPSRFWRIFATKNLRFCSAGAKNFGAQNNSTQDPTAQNNSTHFGFEEVKESEKSRKVYEVFEKVAEKYDLMNDCMSFGIHRIWKDEFVWRLRSGPSTQLLDVAGGTGDIAFRFLRYIRYKYGPDVTGHVTVCDINRAMLEVGRKRADAEGYSNGVTWSEGDAESLPFDAGKFDAFTIAFGIRNCTHVDRVLAEAHRVLKPGGRFACLEFSQVQNPLLARIYDWYSFEIIPVVGQVVAGDWRSYKYLVESIRQFPDQTEFAAMIERAGFSTVKYENLSNGIVAIHYGMKK